MRIMTANEYREAREKLGLSQMALAAAVGVTNKTISNRERGSKPVTKEAEMAILFLLENSREDTEDSRAKGVG